MREYKEIVKAITTGLRNLYSQNDPDINIGGLSSSDMLFPTATGLVYEKQVTTPTGLEIVDWPFPQIKKFVEGTYLFNAGVDSDKLQEVTESSWSTSNVIMEPLDGGDETTTIPGTSVLWHFADMGRSWMAFSGDAVLAKLHQYIFDTTAPNPTDRVQYITAQTVQTGTYFHGRVLMGGFDADDFWLTNWGIHWDSVVSDINDRAANTIENADYDIRDNFVFWSSVGGGDLLHFFQTAAETPEDGYVSGAHGTNYPLYNDYFIRNEWGFMPISFAGSIYKMQPLGNGVAVYGENGIAYMPEIIDPVAGFGLQDVSFFGIAGRGAVAGDHRLHLLLDQSGILWALAPSLEFQRIGFQEYFKPLIDSGETVVMEYDQRTERFYISGYTGSEWKCYVYSKLGLGEVSYPISSLVQKSGTTYAIGDEPASLTAMAVSSTFDFGLRSYKTLTTVEVIGETDGYAEVAVDYRNNSTEDFKRTNYIRLNDRGWARLQVSGVEFRVVVRFQDFTNTAKITEINVWKQYNDRQILRGTYGTEVDTTTD